jgi:mono/diheme cytochrome c family protein
MNYPVWDVPTIGVGLVVAIVATIHVLIAHFAIGGGAFLFVAEVWASRQPDGAKIRAWLHKFATFFLVYTTVFGAMTGVGIWFSIQLANPEATSLLIHQYVFAWATEWVTFLGELTMLYLYYYGWEKNSPRLQIVLAGLYFVIAWLSLFIINGILTFMLTPGGWSLSNPDIAAGFFNPGYLPSLILRTVVMFLVAGLGALLIASRIRDDESLKERIIVFSTRWAIPAALTAPFLFYWYWRTLPAKTTEIIVAGKVGVSGARLESLSTFVLTVLTAAAVILLSNVVFRWKPRALTFASAMAMFLMAQVGFVAAEFAREMARKPYVIYDTLYSNSLWKHTAQDAEQMRRPYLDSARWDPPTEPLSLERGEWLFRFQCSSCHTRDGYRQILRRTESWATTTGFHFLGTLDRLGVMPRFQGDEQDRAALSAYILSLHGQRVTPQEIYDAGMIEGAQEHGSDPATRAEGGTPEGGESAEGANTRTRGPEEVTP